MDDLEMEPEVLDARLKALGCPYKGGDERAAVWLAGFQFGYDTATEEAIKRIEKRMNDVNSD